MAASKLFDTLPVEDGFVMPAEFEPQEAVWLLLATNMETWYNGGYKARKAQYNLIKAINEAGTHVHIGVPHRMYVTAEMLFEDLDVTIHEMTEEDCWIRDTGAIFVKNRETGEVRGVDFRFNSYGGDLHGTSVRYADDDMIARKMLHALGVDRYKTNFILEGGSIIGDGEGTVITTESCLLNENRNWRLDRAGIEEKLHEYLGFEKVIWLKEGIDCGEGETDGHIDDICAFIAPGEVVCCYTDDESHDYYEVFKDCYETLYNATDAKGRKLKVHKLPVADSFFLSTEEAENIADMQGVGEEEDGAWREEGEEAVGSYANFLITNGSIIFPIYGLDSDEEAVNTLREIVGDRYVVRPVNMHDIALGGGSIHCITQQQPK